MYAEHLKWLLERGKMVGYRLSAPDSAARLLCIVFRHVGEREREIVEGGKGPMERWIQKSFDLPYQIWIEESRRSADPDEPIESHESVVDLPSFEELVAWLEKNGYKVDDAKAIEMLRLPDDP